MAKYIKKSAVVAEIERKKIYAQTLGDNAINHSMQQFYDGMKQVCVDFLSALDTLPQEEQEVDLNQEFADFLERNNAYANDDGVISYYNGNSFNHTYDIYPLAKHFYNLGRNLTPYSVGDKIKWKCQDDGRVRTSTIKRIEITQNADKTDVTYFVTIKFKGVLTTACISEEDII